VRLKTSAFTRHHVRIMMTKTKTVGNYVNSILAKREALQAGYDEAILLDSEGYVSEASGENIFIVKNGVLRTPPLTSILPGITRDAILTLARNLGIPTQEGKFSLDDLYLADEAFLTGTAAEVTPIREVDGRIIGAGAPGPISQKLQTAFFAAAKGQDPQYSHWLTYI
jgi:branched-chain amino acid aminotransferase